jgi:endonuclease YncB( thermonuclease family)
MKKTFLALALLLLPASADAAMLHATLPAHVAAPGPAYRTRDAGPPRARTPRRRPPQRRRATPRRSAAILPADRQVVAPNMIHVHDGDTFYVRAEAIRVRGIDTPELGQPRAYEATRRLIQLLHAGPVTIVRRAEDVYGRIVADVYVGGRNVADVLRAEGYAKPRAPTSRAA